MSLQRVGDHFQELSSNSAGHTDGGLKRESLAFLGGSE